MVNSKYDELKQIVVQSNKLWLDSFDSVEGLDVQQISEVLICGMGGSAISGDYLKGYFSAFTTIRVEVNRDYNLNSISNERQIIIVISYSGNTEETLEIANILLEKRKKFVVITSGGKLAEIANENGLQIVRISKGYQPRAAFPLICGTLFGLFKNHNQIITEIQTLRHELTEYDNFIDKHSLFTHAKALTKSLPIIISSHNSQMIATRFRCQLNENAKMPGAEFIIPEFSHNAIVGFDGVMGKMQSIVFIRDLLSHDRVTIQLNLLDQILKPKAKHILTIETQTNHWLSCILIQTWILDYLSILLAEVQNIDPTTVPSIVALKSELNKQNNE